MSAPSAVRRPTSSRWTRCRPWSGLITKLSENVRIGTPIRTSRPSGTEVASRITATTMYETTLPESRARMSNAPPARSASFETVATTSPVESSAPHRVAGARRMMPDDLREPKRRLQPVLHREAVAEDTGDGLDDAEQRRGGRRSGRARHGRRRRCPAGSPARSRTASAPAQPSRRSRRRSRSAIVPIWCRPTQTSNRIGERVSGRPGSATGRSITAEREACTRSGAARAPLRHGSR